VSGMLVEDDGRVASLLEQIGLLLLSHHSIFLCLLGRKEDLFPTIIATMFEHSLHESLMLLILVGWHLCSPQDNMHLSPILYLLFPEGFLSLEEASALDYPGAFQIHPCSMVWQDTSEEVLDELSLVDVDGRGGGVMLESIFFLRVVTEEQDSHLFVHLPTVLYMDDPAIDQLEALPLAELAASQEQDLRLYGQTELGGHRFF
jgi:hypothetical protein